MEKTGIDTSFPLVSVIIPVHNAELYLAEAMTSVCRQSWQNIELIVIDDGSTDDSLQVAKSCHGNQVKILSQRNKGASNARNSGLGVAIGKYVQFLDADDILDTYKIEQQVVLLENEPGKIAVCSTVHFPNGQMHETYSPNAYEEGFLHSNADPVDFLVRLMGGFDFTASMVQPGAWLTPKSLIDQAGPWNETLSLDDDGEFFARVILASSGIVKSPGFVYYRKYPGGGGNLSAAQNNKAMESQLRSVLLKERHLSAQTQSEASRKAIYKQLVELQVKCYLTQPALYRAVSDRMESFPNWSYLPVMGGRLITAISHIFGWKVAKKLQTWYLNHQ